MFRVTLGIRGNLRSELCVIVCSSISWQYTQKGHKLNASTSRSDVLLPTSCAVVIFLQQRLTGSLTPPPAVDRAGADAEASNANGAGVVPTVPCKDVFGANAEAERRETTAVYVAAELSPRASFRDKQSHLERIIFEGMGSRTGVGTFPFTMASRLAPTPVRPTGMRVAAGRPAAEFMQATTTGPIVPNQAKLSGDEYRGLQGTGVPFPALVSHITAMSATWGAPAGSPSTFSSPGAGSLGHLPAMPPVPLVVSGVSRSQGNADNSGRATFQSARRTTSGCVFLRLPSTSQGCSSPVKRPRGRPRKRRMLGVDDYAARGRERQLRVIEDSVGNNCEGLSVSCFAHIHYARI